MWLYMYRCIHMSRLVPTGYKMSEGSLHVVQLLIHSADIVILAFCIAFYFLV